MDCPAAEALLRKRIAKLLRYCRIMPMIHKNELPRMGAQGEPRHGRRVSTVLSGIETLKSIIRTVSKQLRYTLTKECLRCRAVHSGCLRPITLWLPHLLRSIRSYIRVCIGHFCSIVCQSDSLSVVGNDRSALIHSVEQLLCKSRRHIDTAV